MELKMKKIKNYLQFVTAVVFQWKGERVWLTGTGAAANSSQELILIL